ncbi:MAG: amidase [Gemmatimonadetes bacterium]|jgi:Asp-tRNA(Asn)/Glu-tRNA(Gln) amidotransferase A subunit family amidase|nr:amidase [Gemmatimonadota bacterium]MBT5058764.1 amidase [Gemmatimonadota bacterium]MBT5142990.1 amidase [Gemmatimonadota bacterium]MBT5588256.1 amidase [Gemmatimonadota bacterium]MBT5962655.1 amidase [Gemmatimonadota bacterium]
MNPEIHEDLILRLDLVDAREPVLQALLPETERRSRVMAQAQQGPTDGPLAGCLVGVKDILHVDGLPTEAGTQLPSSLFRGAEASCVRLLRTAGAVVLGKTVTTEFAYFEPGPTTNPHDAGHTPGGSSSGSAAAVAAGYCQIALGTQTVGSVIRPAAFCGVFGFKPTYGRIATDGLLLCSASVDTIGLFAPDATLMERAASVIVDGWSPDVDRRGRPLLGVPMGAYLDQASAEARDAFERQLSQLQQVGIEIREIDGVLEDIEPINLRHSHMQAAEMAAEHALWMDQYLDDYRPRTRELLQRGRQVSAQQLAAGRAGRSDLRQRLEAQMTEHGIDAWACPAATGPAPAGLESTGDPVMNLPWTHAGLPAVSIPAGQVGHLPIGLQVVAASNRDETLLKWTQVLASALWPLNEE